MKFNAIDLAKILDGSVVGDPNMEVSNFARIENGNPGDICFFANPKYEKYVYTSKASIIIVNNSFEPKDKINATLIKVDNSYVAIASLLAYFSDYKKKYKRYRGFHSSIKCSSKIGKKVYIGDFSYVGRKAVVGDYTKIYEQVYVGDGVKIGNNCIIYPGVKIYPGMIIGNNVIIHANAVVGSDGFGFAPQEDGTYKKIEHQGNVIVEDNVEIGANTTIDKSQMGSTIIKNGVKIDNLCQIAHNVEIGENTVMAALTGIAGSAVIGKNCMFGGQVGIAGHIKIADRTIIGAQAGVISEVKESGQKLIGMPALPQRIFMRAYTKFRASGKK